VLPHPNPQQNHNKMAASMKPVFAAENSDLDIFESIILADEK
jgi:hypothetical protein